MLGTPGVVALGLEVLVGQREVGVELLVVGPLGVGDLEVLRHLEVDVGPRPVTRQYVDHLTNAEIAHGK